MILVPSYGRDYQTEEEAINAFEFGFDWTIQDVSAGEQNGRQASKRDFKIGDQVKLRFNKLTEFVFVTVKGWRGVKLPWTAASMSELRKVECVLRNQGFKCRVDGLKILSVYE